MSDFPTESDLNGTPTEATFKAAIGLLLNTTKQLPGGQAQSELTISAGQVTPTRPSHSIDTESDAASDDLDNILTTSLPSGSPWLVLTAENVARVVTLKHASGGAGQMHLKNAADIVMNDAELRILLLRVGADWYEIARSKNPLADNYILLQDQKTSGTHGGSFTSGGNRTRNLNAEVHDGPVACTLSSNQFTLVAGTYLISWVAPAHEVANHQSFLYNVTDATEVQRGTTGKSASSTPSNHYSFGSAKVTITSSKAFEIRHRCSTTNNNQGFGEAASFGTEVYTQVEIWKDLQT